MITESRRTVYDKGPSQRTPRIVQENSIARTNTKAALDTTGKPVSPATEAAISHRPDAISGPQEKGPSLKVTPRTLKTPVFGRGTPRTVYDRPTHNPNKKKESPKKSINR